MTAYPGSFAWYELITTDVVSAAAFYHDVVGWGARDASTQNLPYTFFTAGEVPVAGLMELPEEGRKMGARPRWMLYVGVNSVHATTDRIKRLGGIVYVPPTETNIGLISVVADPQAATFALADRLPSDLQKPATSAKVGHIGWHDLLAADLDKAVAFYGEIFGWQKADADVSPMESYQTFSVGGQVIGGAFKKRTEEPVPFWLIYFNVEDLDAAAERVTAAGGKAFRNSIELPSGLAIARCVDPQGAAFALQGKQARTPRLGWSTEWHGFSSRGQLVTSKPRQPTEDSGS